MVIEHLYRDHVCKCTLLLLNYTQFVILLYFKILLYFFVIYLYINIYKNNRFDLFFFIEPKNNNFKIFLSFYNIHTYNINYILQDICFFKK